MSEILKKYAKTHLVALDKKRVSCVDGRQQKNLARSIKRPGADLGEVGALLYLLPNLDGVVAMDAVSHACRKIGRNAYAHTDTHDHSRNAKDCGCGHIKHMMLTNDYYLDPAEMKRAYAIAIQDPHVRWLTLEDDHLEEGVIINKGEKATVVNHNPNKEQMFFVYDALASLRDLQLLVEELKRADFTTFQSISAESVHQAIDMQLGITLTKLRGKNGVFAADMPSITINPNAIFGLFKGY